MSNLWMGGVVLNTDRLDEIAGNLKTNRMKVIDKLAEKGVEYMQEQAAVDTGAMKESVYFVSSDQDNYSSASAAAKAANPKAETGPHPTPKEGAAHVGPCVHYSVYLELGTSKMAARPFVLPGIERLAQEFNAGDNWRELFE